MPGTIKPSVIRKEEALGAVVGACVAGPIGFAVGAVVVGTCKWILDVRDMKVEELYDQAAHDRVRKATGHVGNSNVHMSHFQISRQQVIDVLNLYTGDLWPSTRQTIKELVNDESNIRPESVHANLSDDQLYDLACRRAHQDDVKLSPEHQKRLKNALAYVRSQSYKYNLPWFAEHFATYVDRCLSASSLTK
jgi:hypothetical protein